MRCAVALTVLGTVAQMERRFIKERQREGIERAKADGVHTGGKRRCTEIASKLFTRQETAQPVSLGTFAARECRSIEFLRSGLECHAQSSTRDAFSPLRRRFTLSQSGPSNLCDAGIVRLASSSGYVQADVAWGGDVDGNAGNRGCLADLVWHFV